MGEQGCGPALFVAACFAIVPRTVSLPVKVKPSGRCATLTDLPAGVLCQSTGPANGGGGGDTHDLQNPARFVCPDGFANNIGRRYKMRKISVTVELPQSPELSAQLVQMILSERDPVVKKMLEDILDQLRRDYAQKGI